MQREMRARRIESLTLQPWIGAMKVLFGRNPPRRLARLVFAVNRRLWFGRYRLKCDIQPEVFATAVRKGQDPGRDEGWNEGTTAFSAGAGAF